MQSHSERTIKTLLTIFTVFVFVQSLSQSTDDYVKSIERLRSKGKLTAKSTVDKTFVGSVTAYYDKDSLVLISTLTDAEAAGTETLYFLQRGGLVKAFVMESTFDSNDEWTKYFSRHRAADKCYSCHGYKNCVVTEFTFAEKPTVSRTENKKTKELTGEEKEAMVKDLIKTFEELKALARELR